MLKVISFRKTVVYSLIAALLAWTAGAVLMALVPTAQAAVADGSLVKTADRSAVYYVNGGKRYVFPDQNTYKTWFADFSSVQTISQSELENYLIGGNVTYRPGTYMIKITSDSKTYAVEPGGVLRWVTSEQVAKDLYGDNWNMMIRDVSDAFFVNYAMGADITSSTYPTGTLVKMANDSTIYYIDGSSKRAFADQAAFDANGFQMMHVITTSMDLGSYSNGTAISGAESDLMTVAGPGSSSPVSAGSGLTVALASDTPGASVLPFNATQVNVLNFNVTASSDGPVDLDSVTIKRTGAGNEVDFSNVYIYDGPTRLTTGRSINDDSQSASFNNLDLTIPAGMTKKLSVLVDVASSSTATAGDVHVFSIESASAVSASGTVSGSFPVSGNVMTIASVAAGTVTIAKNGSISNPKVGEKDAKLAEFKITAGSGEDVLFERIALFYAGSVNNGDLSNFELRQSGNVLATASSINSDDLVVLDLGNNAMLIEKGQSKVFELYGDVSGEAKSGSSETILFYLDEDGDLLATGQVYGYGAGVTRTTYDGDSCTASSGDCSGSSVDAGQITITSNGPQAMDVSNNAEDVVLLDFTITSQVEAEFRNFIIRIDGGSGTADLTSGGNALVTDIKVVRKSDGSVVIGPNDLSGSGNDGVQSVTSSERFIQSSGTSVDYQITADLSSSMSNGAKLRASIVAFDSNDIKNLDNNTFISSSDIVPSADILGNTMTVLTPTLELGLASVPVSDTYIKGTSAVPVTAFTFTAGDADDIEITNINLSGYIDEDATGGYTIGTDNNVDVQDIFTTVWLVDSSGNQVGDKESFTGGGVAAFSNFSWTVPAGMTETLTVYTDISSNAYQNSDNEALSVDLASASDVTARDSDGNSVTATGAAPNGTTSPTVVATVTNAGTITVASGPIDSNVESQLIVAGASMQPLANLRFSASNEALEITQLQLRVATDTTDEIKTLYLFDGSTQLGSGVTVNASTGKAKFSFSAGSGFQIDKDDSKTLTVKGDLNTTSLGADSGATVAVDFMYDTNFEARGVGQSDTLITSVGSADVSSQDHFVYKTVPTVSSVSLGSSTLLNGAENDIYAFKVTADAAEDVSLKQVKLEITSSTTGSGSIGTFRFFRGNNDITDNVSIVDGSGQSLESGGQDLGEGATSAYIIFSTEELITAGSSTTFTVKATLSGFTAGADYINTKIGDDTTTEEGHKYLDTDSNGLINLTSATSSGTETVAQDFIWSDNSATPHYSNTSGSNRSADWFNGYLVDNLPTTSLTVQVPN